MKITEDDIKQLLSNLIARIDYDLWKEYFVYLEEDNEELDELIAIVDGWLYAKGITEGDYAPSTD